MLRMAQTREAMVMTTFMEQKARLVMKGAIWLSMVEMSFVNRLMIRPVGTLSRNSLIFEWSTLKIMFAWIFLETLVTR